MFEKAAKMKLRFNYRGVCTVEDLWDLPVRELDSIYKTLNADLKDQEGESLLETKNKEQTSLTLKIDIVKHIVNTKLEEAKEKEDRLLKAQKKEKILNIIAEKQDEALKDMSVEDLSSLVNSL